MDNKDKTIVHVGFAKDDCPIGTRHYVGSFRLKTGEKVLFEANSIKDIDDNLLLLGIEPLYTPIAGSENILLELKEHGLSIKL